MEIRFSILSKNKTLIGISIERNGKVKKDSRDKAVFQSTIDITIGLIFGYITIEFNQGKAVGIMDMVETFNDNCKDINEIK